jgi:hypothetical protein
LLGVFQKDPPSRGDYSVTAYAKGAAGGQSSVTALWSASATGLQEKAKEMASMIVAQRKRIAGRVVDHFMVDL